MLADKVKSMMESPVGKKVTALFCAAKDETFKVAKKTGAAVWTMTRQQTNLYGGVSSAAFTGIGLLVSAASIAIGEPWMIVGSLAATGLWGAATGVQIFQENEEAIRSWQPFKPKKKPYQNNHVEDWDPQN